jgi:hypothetical protein
VTREGIEEEGKRCDTRGNRIPFHKTEREWKVGGSIHEPKKSEKIHVISKRNSKKL